MTRSDRALPAPWSALADRAFATSLADPASYGRTLRLVRATADALRARHGDAADLVAAWSARATLLHELAEADDLLTTEGLDLDAVAGAAFAMRHRELAAERIHAQRLATLAARDEESGWVVLEESGPYRGDPFVPYRRLEVDTRSGQAILATTQANDDFTAPVHLVESLHLDLATGRLTPPAEETADAEESVREYASVEERETRVATLRSEQLPEPPVGQNTFQALPPPVRFL